MLPADDRVVLAVEWRWWKGNDIHEAICAYNVQLTLLMSLCSQQVGFHPDFRSQNHHQTQLAMVLPGAHRGS